MTAPATYTFIIGDNAEQAAKAAHAHATPRMTTASTLRVRSSRHASLVRLCGQCGIWRHRRPPCTSRLHRQQSWVSAHGTCAASQLSSLASRASVARGTLRVA
jgi:hypothetical protein